MRGHHEELDAFPFGRSPPLANAPAAAASGSNTNVISNGRPPFASVARQTAAPASTGNRFPPPSSAPPPPPRRTLSSLSTATVHSSSVSSMMDESVESQISLGFAGGNGNGGGGGSGSNSHKRPLASLNPNSSSSGTDGGAADQVSGGEDGCSTMVIDGDAANYRTSSSICTGNRGAAAGAISPAWSSATMSTAPSVPTAGPPAVTVQPTSNKRSRPTPTLSAIRHRLASKLVAAVQKTPHSDVARPYTTVVECLSGEERRVGSGAATMAAAATSNGVPYGLFFTPDQALTRVGWEVREVAGKTDRTTTTTVWTLYGSAASEWIQSAMEGGNGGAQPRQPYHIHPVPYDGPVRVGYGGKRERMYAYAGVEALEAKFESNGTTGGNNNNGGGDGMLTLTVRTYLAGLVDEAKVTFSPWG